MRDPARINRIIDKLRKAWLTSPDLRLGQLVMTAVAFGQEEQVNDIFYIEDDVTEHGLDIMLSDDRFLSSHGK
jgi:uncharacterized protein YihD (DUF1040 family)